jgi:hypothetical protein
MDYVDFKKDFPERTLDILISYNGEYEVSLLLNCLLALIVLPKEKFYENIPEEIPSDWGLTKENVKKVPCESCGYKLKEIVRHMRNAISHMRIKTKSDDEGNISMILFQDSGNFKLEIPVDDLKTFVTKLTEYVIERKKQSFVSEILINN